MIKKLLMLTLIIGLECSAWTQEALLKKRAWRRRAMKNAPRFYTEIGTTPWTQDDIVEAFESFYSLYKQRPIKDNWGGMRLPHMFYTWFIVKKLQPEVIIESGVLRGQGTWVLEQAAPNAKIISLDPDLSKLVYTAKNATYSTIDFCNHSWDWVNKDTALCFLDDHQGTQRIRQCQALGFKHIIYEDNFPFPGENFTGDHSPKWSLLATTASYMDLNRVIRKLYRYNSANLNTIIKKAWQHSLETNFKREKENAAFLHQTTEVYHEFPPLIQRYPHNFNWPYDKFYEISKHPLFAKLPEWILEKLPPREFKHAYLAYIKLY